MLPLKHIRMVLLKTYARTLSLSRTLAHSLWAILRLRHFALRPFLHSDHSRTPITPREPLPALPFSALSALRMFPNESKTNAPSEATQCFLGGNTMAFGNTQANIQAKAIRKNRSWDFGLLWLPRNIQVLRHSGACCGASTGSSFK